MSGPVTEALGDITPVLKELYDGNKLTVLAYENRPFLAVVPKAEGFGGKFYPVPTESSSGQGISANFTNAYTNQTPDQYEEFQLTRVSKFALATISGEAWEASEGNEAAFVDAYDQIIRNKLNDLMNEAAIDCFGDGTGVRGAIGSISTGVITLADPSTVTRFEKGMVLQAGTGTASPHAAVGYVIAVNRRGSSTTVTVTDTFGSSTAATPSGWIAADVLYRQGDKGSVIAGTAGWVPTTAPTVGGGDSWFTVDRSPDSRLYGIYEDHSDLSISEALLSVGATIQQEGGMPNIVVMGPRSYQALVTELDSKVRYGTLNGSDDAAIVGFETIKLAIGGRIVDVLADPFYPGFEALVMRKEDWELRTLGKLPRQIDLDELKVERNFTADEYQTRFVYRGNLYCRKPGQQARVKLGA